jgi:hypothetical protein
MDTPIKNIISIDDSVEQISGVNYQSMIKAEVRFTLETAA